MTEKVKPGSMAMFTDYADKKTLNGPYYYVGPTKEGGHVSVSSSGNLLEWCIVEPIPEPKYNPFTRETIPKNALFSDVESGHWRMAQGYTASDVYFSIFSESYETICEAYRISLDGGKTWGPAGEKVTE